MKMKRLALLLTALSLLAAAVGVGVLQAQEAQDEAATAQTAQDTDMIWAHGDRDRGPGGRGGRDGGPGGRGGMMRGGMGFGLLNLVGEETGLTVREIGEALRDGGSLGALLAESGVDEAAFIETVVTAASERLTTAVENGRLTQERADALIAELRERLPDILNWTRPAAPNTSDGEI
jgi:hypothetical protein